MRVDPIDVLPDLPVVGTSTVNDQVPVHQPVAPDIPARPGTRLVALRKLEAGVRRRAVEVEVAAAAVVGGQAPEQPVEVHRHFTQRTVLALQVGDAASEVLCGVEGVLDPISAAVPGMSCRSPMAPAGLIARGSPALSVWHCARIQRQPSGRAGDSTARASSTSGCHSAGE
jgi:hypothetical protein